MDSIKTHIQYWMDYKGKGDEYRKSHDLDCMLTGGNLYADTLISLWLPLRYVLNDCGTDQWEKYRKIKTLKDNDEFMTLLKEQLPIFIPDEELRMKLERLFQLGRTRANVIILPYRRWNSMRGRAPYWEYFPHFLYDLLNTQDTTFLEAIQEWIVREHLEMFFDGPLVKENILDLCGSGKPWSHNPGKPNFDVPKLIDYYIQILEERSRFF